MDGKISLNEASVLLLRDTLAILSCDEIKLQSLKTRPEDAEPATDASGMAEVFQAVAKKTLISQVRAGGGRGRGGCCLCVVVL